MEQGKGERQKERKREIERGGALKTPQPVGRRVWKKSKIKRRVCVFMDAWGKWGIFGALVARLMVKLFTRCLIIFFCGHRISLKLMWLMACRMGITRETKNTYQKQPQYQFVAETERQEEQCKLISSIFLCLYRLIHIEYIEYTHDASWNN